MTGGLKTLPNIGYARLKSFGLRSNSFLECITSLFSKVGLCKGLNAI